MLADHCEPTSAASGLPSFRQVATRRSSWPSLGRQVRVEGTAERAERAEAERYFATRPRGSQLGAWASPQSAVIPDRETLDALVAAVEERFDEEDLPAPPFWGGYRVLSLIHI